MPTIRMFGTPTSPYVRRVRVIAAELDLTLDTVDTGDEAGQQALRQASPLWKVPTVVLDGDTLIDSHTITEALLREFGPGPFLPHDPTDRRLQTAMNAVDGAIDSLINGLYLHRDGVLPAQSSYIDKQIQRASATMNWIDEHVGERGFTDGQLSLVNVALITTLDWMDFRNTYDLDRHPKLRAIQAHWRERPSFAATYPKTTWG